MNDLAIVVPCFNESLVLSDTADKLLSELRRLERCGKVSNRSQICFVDDGSLDGSWECITQAHASDSRVHGIKLTRNHGHQFALLAGLLTVSADMAISIDADLQDDISVIEKMVDEYRAGKDVVFGVREDRSTDSRLKRMSAEGYYRLLRCMGVNIVFNHADCRLLSRRALEALREFGETNLFLRGVIPTIGLPSATVSYKRQARQMGESNYSIRKMISLGIDGITSFSIVPLRVIAALGLTVFLGSLLLAIWALWVRFALADVVPGWASSVLPQYFLGGIQLLSIGVLGEYVAKIYIETKRRPRFLIEKVI